MTCPRKDNCELESLYKIVMDKQDCAEKYATLANSLPIIRHTLCGSDSYEECPFLADTSLEVSTSEVDSKQGNPFRSYEEMNNNEIYKANSEQ